ncbi:hypothetical protein AN32_02639, partial [Mycobacterium tuberculosis M984]
MTPVVRPKTPRGDGNPATIAPARADDSGRQTQNPERGRKPISGTATLREDTPSRQTQNPERGRKPDDEQRHTEPRIRQVVRPKTPRGDGNLERVTADGTIETSRQTQNPERGRKPSWWDMDERDYRGRQTQNP